MNKRLTLAALAAAGLLATSNANAQIDLGGAVSRAIGQATGNNQAGTTPAPGAQVSGQAAASGALPAANANVGGNVRANVGNNLGLRSGINANANNGLNAAANTTQPGNQSWLGRVGNDLRGALQQADNGVMRFQDNLNQNLQQYGFQSGDQLVNANGQVVTQAQLDQYLQSNPNQVRVLRNGQIVPLNVNAQSYSAVPPTQPYSSSSNFAQPGYATVAPGGRLRLGITMTPTNNEVQVLSVLQGSPAEAAGLRPGDRIMSVNGQEVLNPDQMMQAVAQIPDNQPLNLRYRRAGQTMNSQIFLAGSANTGVYQAGYSQPSDFGPASGDINARLDQLERMVQDLRDEVRQLSQGPVAP